MAAERRSNRAARPWHIHEFGGLELLHVGDVLVTVSGNDPKVVSLVYAAAFTPDAGPSIVDISKGLPKPSPCRNVATSVALMEAAYRLSPVRHPMGLILRFAAVVRNRGQRFGNPRRPSA
jgi:hypothetical protein